MLKIARFLLVVFVAPALAGCALFSDAPHYRGIAVTQHELDELTPGTSSQADVMALLGPPTVHEQFEDDNWIYVSQITKMRIARNEGMKSQHVVVLSFDNNGVLRTVTQKNTADAVQVAMDAGRTPVPGGQAGFLQQLVGGVGSYNPLGSASDTSAGGAGPGSNIGGAGGGAGGGLGGGGL